MWNETAVQVVTSDRVKIEGLRVSDVERIEREGDYFPVTVDRYRDAVEALMVIAGVLICFFTVMLGFRNEI